MVGYGPGKQAKAVLAEFEKALLDNDMVFAFHIYAANPDLRSAMDDRVMDCGRWDYGEA